MDKHGVSIQIKQIKWLKSLWPLTKRKLINIRKVLTFTSGCHASFFYNEEGGGREILTLEAWSI